MSNKSNNAKGAFGRPRSRSTMMLSELDALAGLDALVGSKDEPVIVRYKPQTKEEAAELLESLILVSDWTSGNREPRWYAGFSKDDLLDGKAGVHVTMGRKEVYDTFKALE
jgi:hypothetical protein